MAMRGVMMLFFQVLILCFQAKAWHAVRRSFELEHTTAPQEKLHLITDCMHVTSEEGEFSFVKLPPVRSTSKHGAHWMTPGVESAERADPDDPTLGAATVCGVYFVADPDQTIEVTMRQVNVDCRTGGLMAFVDGWELNGQYFPGERDHEKPLELRVQEFCAEQGASAGGGPWPPKTVGAASNAWVFRSSQNAALVQYRIPERGSFVLSARFHHNPKPCNIMAEGLAPYYMLRNYGLRRNCTLTALFPAVVSVVAVEVGEINESVRYCERVRMDDRLEVGGSVGLDPSYQLVRASTICGRSRGRVDLDQTILCGTTSVRLISSGRYSNQAMVTMRMADESDLQLATVICEM
ncbi:corticotropin-releasing factor-binding protein [Anopheles arabiensis]|uniref:Corticotropin-releasing factor-binding protein n=1 Tax=Anopheles arabiensis TaxID=7173 RepID=A0A8W7MTV9_ANOAR|nr:corticotropin-releasing factor-binding protein [Anopheles arabiensis]XP_040172409.1 corticotropin-releasing factor-binding protein [Anopheles arabiensis]XP_040172410.1 corticotropin-releasing factor-binding protein [Anopheles arabiensis]XP_040172411.1 corticotropin-releasing factor-binding protein [Anopheles arabiensis]